MQIEIPKDKLVKLVKETYDLSVPQGMGFLHFTPAPLSDEEAESMVCYDNRIAVHMDYVSGRACKMTVFKEDKKYFFETPWYDHTDEQQQQLLNRLDIELADELAEEKHSHACNCLKCQSERPSPRSR